jgi:hypothetical protein
MATATATTGNSGALSAMLRNDMGKMSEDVKAYQKSFTMMQDNFVMTKKLLGDLQTWDQQNTLTPEQMRKSLKDISVSIFIISQQEKAKERLREKMLNINRADEISTQVYKTRSDVLYSNLSIVLAIISIVIITVMFNK